MCSKVLLGKALPGKMYRAAKQSEYCNCWSKLFWFFKPSSRLRGWKISWKHRCCFKNGLCLVKLLVRASWNFIFTWNNHCNEWVWFF